MSILLAIIFGLVVVAIPAATIAIHGIWSFNKQEAAALRRMGVSSFSELL